MSVKANIKPTQSNEKSAQPLINKWTTYKQIEWYILQEGNIYKVLHNFEAELDEDLSAEEGEILTQLHVRCVYHNVVIYVRMSVL